MVGANGFEPSTSWSRTRRASQAALRPDKHRVYETNHAHSGKNKNITRRCAGQSGFSRVHGFWLQPGAAVWKRKIQLVKRKTAGNVTLSGGFGFDRG